MGISTHILDVAQGRPARDVSVMLEFEHDGAGWQNIGQARTDADGRVSTLLPADFEFKAGTYRIIFATGAYFAGQAVATFYPSVTVTFAVRDAEQHYHVPLLISPFGYSTYRGS